MKAKYNISMTGFVLSFLMIGMIMVFFSMFSSELYSSYGTSENTDNSSVYDNYNKYDEIQDLTENLTDTAYVKQDVGITDVIGGYFSAGFKALQLAWVSKNQFNAMVNQASDDIPVLGFVMDYFLLIITVLILIGVIISVFFKMRI